MTDARAHRERVRAGIARDVARVAVVAVAARRLERLAEIAEDVLAAAARRLRIAAHHLDACALVLLAAVLRQGGRFRRIVDRDGAVPHCDDSVGAQGYEARVGEPSERR